MFIEHLNLKQLNLKKKKRRTVKTKTKQITRAGTESEKWRSHGGFSVGIGRGGMVVKGTGNKNNW